MLAGKQKLEAERQRLEEKRKELNRIRNTLDNIIKNIHETIPAITWPSHPLTRNHNILFSFLHFIRIAFNNSPTNKLTS